jgi:hypothetical protein
VGQRAVLFDATGATWEWDGETWSQIVSTGPGPRDGTALAGLNGKVILFGGNTTVGVPNTLGDTWEWNGTVWTKRSDTGSGPSARKGHAMATLNGKVTVFGGEDMLGQYPTDTWEYDGTTWKGHGTTMPGGRINFPMATRGSTIVLFGGQSATNVLGDLEVWDGNAWTPVTGMGTMGAPDNRFGAAMAGLGTKAIMFGGGFTADTATWTWDGSLWEKWAAAGPSSSDGIAMVTWGNQVLLHDQFETWVGDGTGWTRASTTGPGPGPMATR